MKKDILLKFKDFLGTYDEEEKKKLYNVLTALRGPDNDIGTRTIKQVFTCEMRDAIGFDSELRVLPRKHGKKLAIQLRGAGVHWGWHTKKAIMELVEAKLISSKYLKFFIKIETLGRKK